MNASPRHVQVDIEIPPDIALQQSDMQQLLRESAYIELYRRGLIGSGYAAARLGLERSAFLDLLSAHGVSWLDDTLDVAQEAKNAQP